MAENDDLPPLETMPREEALERFAALYQRYLEARREADEALRRTERMNAVTSGLAEALDPHEVADVILNAGLVAAGAAGGGVAVREGDLLRVVAAVGYDPAKVSRYADALPLDTPVPLAHACKQGELVLLGNLREWEARFPLQPVTASAHRAWAAVPLIQRGRCIGVLGVSYAEERVFTAPERDFLLGLGSQCAQALHRAQLFAAERQARAAAEEAVRVREEFLSIASHELRTPLTPLVLQLAILRRQIEAPALAAKVEMAQRQTERLSRLVGNLLDVAQIASGQMQLDLQDVELSAVAQGVLERLHEETLRAGCAVSLRAERAACRVDLVRIEQVVSNLIGNAIKYGAGKPVEVEISRRDGSALLSVRDHGIGVPIHAHRRIFERFERAVSGREYGGLGLGLFICRQIVDAHGGHISLKSAPGHGSTFTVELPLR